MPDAKQDIWAQWLLQRRFGGDRERMKAVLNDCLYPIRDKVLGHTHDADRPAHVGCTTTNRLWGAGQGQDKQVIFIDISTFAGPCSGIAREMQVVHRCEFLRATADDLSPIPDASVDVVTTRSVLIYVSAKQKAFAEFFRVLKPGGRLSIFEPINRFSWPEPSHLLCGYDVTPIIDIVDKVKALYLRLQPPDTDPMTDFDERDLIGFAEKAGFQEIHLELQVEIKPPTETSDWDAFMRVAGNPKIPTFEEAIAQTLTAEEAEKFVAHLRPLVEARQGTARSR
jgi:SAM-dependent methyltransferase